MSGGSIAQALLQNGVDDVERRGIIAAALGAAEFEFVEDLQGMSVSAFRAKLLSAQNFVLSSVESSDLERLSACCKVICSRAASNSYKRARVDNAGVGHKGASGAEVAASMICTASSSVHNVRHHVPMQALGELERHITCEEQRLLWLDRARINAIAGCCPKSHKSLISGIRCWIAFAQRVLKLEGREFPPSVNDLLQWSALFRNSGTFKTI